MTNRRNQLNPLLGPWLAGAVLLGLPGSVLPVLAHADEPVSQVEQSACAGRSDRTQGRRSRGASEGHAGRGAGQRTPEPHSQSL